MGSSRKGAIKSTIWRTGEPFVWASAAALTLVLLISVSLLGVVLINGIGVLWPSTVYQLDLEDGSAVMGELRKEDAASTNNDARVQLKVGNRDLYQLDFRWVPRAAITSQRQPADAVVLERREYGNFYGYLSSVESTDLGLVSGPDAWASLHTTIEALAMANSELDDTRDFISDLTNDIRSLELQEKKLRYQGAADDTPALREILEERALIQARFDHLLGEYQAALATLRTATAIFVDADGTRASMPILDIVRAYRPNQMSLLQKSVHYVGKIRELLFDEPREANTEGGLFPAIFGTVMLIFVMSIFSFPLGVLAGIYLREYAKEGPLLRAVYIAVNNLAGIPSIVYGLFGLGFLVYGVGGSLDQFFFPERLPTPTFGTGGLLWASLTLGLLTVPVVIVATDEALGTVPKGIRESSYALGATRLQTLWRCVLPVASPGIMTGFILAMARAAGEVAPLMITGVVKLAPALALDGQFPYLHLDRKFMHLGFHIYDIGFQSPNVEAAMPMVFVTTLLLVLIVVVMSSIAIYFRARMRRRFAVKSL